MSKPGHQQRSHSAEYRVGGVVREGDTSESDRRRKCADHKNRGQYRTTGSQPSEEIGGQKGGWQSVGSCVESVSRSDQQKEYRDGGTAQTKPIGKSANRKS